MFYINFLLFLLFLLATKDFAKSHPGGKLGKKLTLSYRFNDSN